MKTTLLLALALFATLSLALAQTSGGRDGHVNGICSPGGGDSAGGHPVGPSSGGDTGSGGKPLS